MAADGRIVIETKIDTSGIKDGQKEVENQLEKTADKAEKVGKNMTKYVTVPFTAMGAAGVKSALDFSGAQKEMQQQLGVTKEEAEELTEIANNIYKKGFSGSLAETSDALIKVKQNMGDLVNESDLEEVTKNAYTLAQVMEEDVGWVTRASSTLMREFGTDAEEAFDLLAWGQQNGLNYSDELLDNIAEYGPLFSEMGYSAEEYFAILKSGTEEGAYNLDYVNDVMKEFQIRIKDGSKTTADAMEQMSEETQKVWQSFIEGEGTVKDVSDAVLKELAGMEDEVLRNILGVELFGTKWEDLEADAVIALGNVEGSIGDLDGTMKDITETQENSFGARFQRMLRETMDALRPIGEILLDVGENVLPVVTDVVGLLAKGFSALPEPIQSVVVVVGALAAALGPLMALFSPVLRILGSLRLATLGWSAAIGGIVTVVLVVVGYIVTNWEQIWEVTKAIFGAIWDFLKGIWEAIIEFFKATMEFLKELITNIWEGIKGVTEAVWNAIKTFFTNIWEGIKNTVSTVVNTIKNTISGVWNTIKEITSNVFGWVKSFLEGIWDGILNGVEVFKNVFLSIWEGIKAGIRMIVNPIAGIINGIMAGIESVLNAIAKAINAIPSIKIPNWVPIWGGNEYGIPEIPLVSFPRVPMLDTGTNFVARDGLAYLHRGEAVVPAEHNGPYSPDAGKVEITIEHMEVRDDNDIQEIARELYKLQRRTNRGGING